MAGLYSHTTRGTGTVLTASIYNTDHQNHIDNAVPQQHDDYSSGASQMQSAVDPGESGSESLATSLAGELERLRFAIKDHKNYLGIEPGSPQWYSTPTGLIPVNRGGSGASTAAGARTAFGVASGNDIVTTISGNTTLVAGDVFETNVITATADVTLPAASALADGDKFYFKSTTTGNVRIVPAGSDTIDGVNAAYRLPSFCNCTVMRNGAGAFVLLKKPDVSVGDWVWAGYGTAKSGWLKAGSGDQSRTTLAGLFAEYSTIWGAGDGSTTFGIPDARGKAPVQAGTGTVVATGVDADVDITANEFIVPSNTRKWTTGMQVNFTLSSGTITGLTSGNNYFVIRMSATRISLASTLADAQNGVEIDFTGKSSPVWTLTHTYEARTLGDYGGEEAHATSLTELLAHTHPQDPLTALEVGGGSTYNGGTTRSQGGTTQSRGGNAAANIMSPFLVGELYIKT